MSLAPGLKRLRGAGVEVKKIKLISIRRKNHDQVWRCYDESAKVFGGILIQEKLFMLVMKLRLRSGSRGDIRLGLKKSLKKSRLKLI